MTAESERSASDGRYPSRSGPKPNPDPDLSALPDDSPELLRWRADALMEEMMLGAVDVSAADSSRAPASPAAPADEAGGAFAPEEAPAPDPWPASPTQNGAGQAENGFDAGVQSAPAPASYPRPNRGPAGISDSGEWRTRASSLGASARDGTARDEASRANGPAAAPASPSAGSTPSPAATPTPDWRIVSGTGASRATDAGSGEYSPPSYGATGYEAVAPQKWQPEFSDEESDAGGARTPRPTDAAYTGAPLPGYGPARPADETNGQPVEQTPRASSASSASSATDAGYSPSYVSAMAVLPSGPRRSALLPRMSEFDAEALSREIADLHAEIRKILPVGHETAERAQHLLDKANTILTSDPMRSAEVEYYMQQVRSIVQRMRQAHRWSNLYRDRLRIYLGAWALLAIVALTALALFPVEAENFAAGITGAASDSLFVLNFVGLVGTVMAGALGGALGALLTMRKHAGADHSLFDRKYGLRGLLLPIIGALAGALIYLVFGVVYAFARINPSLNVVAVALPTLLAFALGFSQESIYGTRE